jgi:hypothetical protein
VNPLHRSRAVFCGTIGITTLSLVACVSVAEHGLAVDERHPASRAGAAGSVADVASLLRDPRSAADSESRAQGREHASESAPKSSPPAAVDPAEARYACPMHPEVVAARAGRCSLCGMALKERTSEESDAEGPHER